MRLIYIPVAIAALLLGLAIGLISRGERVEDLPQRATQLVEPMPDSSAAASHAPNPNSTAVNRPTTFTPGAVKVAGLMVHRTLAREGDNGEELAFFGTFAKTRVALELDLARVPGAGQRHIVSLLPDSSVITRFVDDRGTDLAAEPSQNDLLEMLPRVSADGLGLQTVVASKIAPHPNATRVIVEGTLDLLCASDKTSADSAPVALEVGSTLSVGPLSFEVVSTGSSDWDPDKWNLELKTTDPLQSVISWSLVDESGAVIPLSESMTWSMNGTVQKTLVAPSPLAKASLRLELWTDGETISVPFSVSAGVGLQ